MLVVIGIRVRVIARRGYLLVVIGIRVRVRIPKSVYG